MAEDLKRQSDAAESSLDLTQAIRQLKIPGDESISDVDDLARQHRVLLIARDRDIKKWARRWLERKQLEVTTLAERDFSLTDVLSTQADVIVIEAALYDPYGEYWVSVLSKEDALRTPIIALCSGSKDLGAALDAGVYEIVRKPYEWRLLGTRARRASRRSASDQELSSARSSLAEALRIAESARSRLRSQESFEPVTGLPNKKKFVDLLRRGMHAVDRDGNAMAVFVIGFNRFRLVVEAMGQDHADLVLTEIGKHLSDCLKDADSVQSDVEGMRTSAAANIDQARFALMLTCSGNHDKLLGLQQQLVERMSRPVHIDGQAVYLSACVGVSMYPQDASDADSLLQRADNAMRNAQSRGGGFKFYCQETDAAASRKLMLEHMLHEALNNGELSLEYQPIFSAASGRMDAVEALLRWRQADGSLIAPIEFVPVAEESGLMNRVGEFVLVEACRQWTAWRSQAVDVGRMCVNVSKVQLMHGGFSDLVQRTLSEFGMDPASLELELSERGVFADDAGVAVQLHELKELGVRLSIDDFGTGDAAIGYLRDLPVDVLKIDRSYVQGIAENEKDSAIAAAIIALGHSLNLSIVAEGVETDAQRELLRSLGCDSLQGFLTGRPVTAEVLEATGKTNKKNSLV